MRTNRRSYLKGLAGAAAAAGLAGCSGESGGGGSDGDGGSDGGGGTITEPQETKELRVAYHFPENHYTPEGSITPYLDRVSERANVEFDVHPGGQLGSPTEYLGQIQGGSIDMAVILPIFHIEEMSAATVSSLPLPVTDLGANTRAMHDLRDTFYETALEDVGLRQLVPTQFGTYDLFTVDKPVTSAAGWEDLVLRSSGWVHDRVAQAFGASGEGISPTEMYEALQRGTVDGMIWPVQSIPPYSLQEQANHWVGGDEVNLGGNAGNLYIGDNVFTDLSDDTQDVFIDEIEQSVIDGSEFTKETREAATQTTLDAGVERHDIEDPEVWQDNISGIRGQWVDLGDSHESVLDEFESSLQNYV